ncbi:MAG: MATE family efflux transporter, partial [Isosphaeraceae bacterium]|nr:MATE family efflux transporter [Isosphaeraceae bacterium]
MRATLALALPVVLAELGWMAMGVVDLIMVGRLGPEAIGAVGIGNVLYFSVIVFGVGLLLGLDTLVSQAFGAGKLEDCHRSLVQGVYLSLALSPPLMAVIALGKPALHSLGIDPAILRVAIPYLETLNWGTLPLLLYASLRRYLQGMGLVRPVMGALVVANLVNVAGNWVLVYGRLGAPALGVVGSGWSTCLARVAMLLILAGYAIWYDRRHCTGRGLLRTPWTLDLARVRRLLALGFPAAMQIELEVGVFAAAATLAGRLGPTALAAHEVVLHAASVTFMVPLGVSSAGAVRVGQALGRG